MLKKISGPSQICWSTHVRQQTNKIKKHSAIKAENTVERKKKNSYYLSPQKSDFKRLMLSVYYICVQLDDKLY